MRPVTGRKVLAIGRLPETQPQRPRIIDVAPVLNAASFLCIDDAAYF